jgi:hypothetical protein
MPVMIGVDGAAHLDWKSSRLEPWRALGLAGLALFAGASCGPWRPTMALDMLPMQGHGYWRFEHVGEPGYG